MSNAGSNLGDKVRDVFEAAYDVGESIRLNAMDFVDSFTGTSGRHEDATNTTHEGTRRARGDQYVQTREYSRTSEQPGPVEHQSDASSVATDNTVTAENTQESAQVGEKKPVQVSAEEARRGARLQMDASEKASGSGVASGSGSGWN